MKTVLITAYAVNPYKGSEDGMGWNFIYQAATKRPVIAITRKNNRQAIKKYLKENNLENHLNLNFCYFDLPYWARFWKKGGRGAMLYFYLWQFFIVRFIKKKKLQFDIAHNLNFHNDWTPSFLWRLGKPLVWGPVGHHPAIPKEYLGQYPALFRLKEHLKWGVKNLFWNIDPFLKKTRSSAEVIIKMNTRAKVGNTNARTELMPSVGCEDLISTDKPLKNGFNVLAVGRLVPLKGFDLTLDAFILFLKQLSPEDRDKVSLTIIGSGELRKDLIDKIKYEPYKNIRLIEWVDRSELKSYYENSSVFMFPSHEGAGMVVAEAFSHGLPVICLDNEGPGEFVDQYSGLKVPYLKDYHQTIEDLASALDQLYRHPEQISLLSEGARKRFLSYFSWDVKGKQLNRIYDQML